MTDTIVVNEDTPADELVTIMEAVLDRLIEKIGVGATVGMLFGTAVLVTIEDSKRHV